MARLIRPLLLSLLIATPAMARTDAQIIQAYRSSRPSSEWQRVQHVTLHPYADDDHQRMLGVLRWLVASNSRTQPIEPTMPHPTESPSLWMLDVDALQWEFLPSILAKRYPYYSYHGTRPAVIRADWLIVFLLDQTISGQASNKLTFGKAVSAESDYMDQFGAAPGDPITFIEDNSGVAIQKTRSLNLQNTASEFPIWFTRDFRTIDQDSDPLENLLRKSKHQATEVISALPKLILSTGERCLAQHYALFNGAGKGIYAAPIDIVFDHRAPRGTPELRASVSCVACHQTGLNQPTANAVRQFTKANLIDVEDASTAIAIQAKYLTKLDRSIQRWNQDYATFVEATFQGTPTELSEAVLAICREYDRPVTLNSVASELSTSADNLKVSLRSSQVPIDLPARVIGLTQGMTMPRAAFEEHFPKLWNLIHTKAPVSSAD